MERNWAQEFDEMEDKKRERELTERLRDTIEKYELVKHKSDDERIKTLEKVLESFKDLFMEGFEINEKAYKYFEEELRYSKFRKEYQEENPGIEIIDNNDVHRNKSSKEDNQKRKNAEDEDELEL